ncbi:ornithine decarboxylase [Ranunculus cassubicifolius]
MGSEQIHEEIGTLYSRNLQVVLNANAARNKEVKKISKGGVSGLIHSIVSGEQEEVRRDPFYVLDLGVVSGLMDQWVSRLPNVKPFYAVKCNHEPSFVAALAALGVGFDCASKAEIEAALALGISADRIVYANPCKAEAHIKYAAEVGVNLTTFDSEYEVEKIKKWHPKCGLLIRIKAGDDGDARCPLGPKYGALPNEVTPLLQAASAAGLPVVGVSFHVGSATTYSQSYHSAIAAAKAVFDTALQLGMPRMHTLNIGGGFFSGKQFDEAAVTITDSLKTYFGSEPNLEIISEPGRFFAEASFTLATCIIGKRVRGELREYWINDGLYGSMNCMLYDHATVTAKPLASNSDPTNPNCVGAKTYPSTVFGPTCDALDTILTDYQLPDLQVNDWLVFPNMGAYTACAGSKFNGFDTSAIPTYVAYSDSSIGLQEIFIDKP